MEETNSSPLALANLDEHPAIVAAYQRTVVCEQALRQAAEALQMTEEQSRAADGRRITRLLEGGTLAEDETPVLVATAEREVRLSRAALQRAVEEHAAIKERIRGEMDQKCRAIYAEHLSEAVELAEKASAAHTLLGRLHSRMLTLCGPLSFNNHAYGELVADEPRRHFSSWREVVAASGLLGPQSD